MKIISNDTDYGIYDETDPDEREEEDETLWDDLFINEDDLPF